MEPDLGTFRALIELCPMVTYVCDETDALTYISPQIEQWTGMPVRLWTEEPGFWKSLLHPDDREHVEAALALGGPLDIEYRMRGHGGNWIWIWEQEVPTATGSQGVCVDITALHNTRTALETTRARLRATINAAPLILLATDADGVITLSEGKGLESLGLEPGEVVGRSLFDVYAERPELIGDARRALAGETFETRFQQSGRTFDCAWRPMDDGSLMCIAMDVTARQVSEERLSHLAYHDQLTGLPNRSTVEEQLERELARAQRDGTSVAALYIDLDHFKLVNDSLGHAAGDDVLVQVARRVGAITRTGDVLARLGGDEFLLLLPGLGEEAAAAARTVAAKVLATLDAPLRVEDAEFQVGASIGIALGPDDARGAADLLKHSDAAMYQAKRAGRHGLAVYSGDSGASRRRLTLTARLSRALTGRQLVLHYQPVHELGTGELVSVEALVRWQDPVAGLLGPGSFLPLAEETGMITQIGDWVLDEALRQAAGWGASGLRPRLCVNASARELCDDGYAERVAAALQRHDVDPGQLLIEVSESGTDESTRAKGVIGDLHVLGVRLALDDFGTEASSLSRLRELPVDVLKVDRSFLRDLPGDDASAAIVRAIATLGSGLGMDVVAEGIETQAQRDWVALAGCGYGQGYLFARPQPADGVLELLTSSLAPSRRADRASARSPAESPRR
jgi:diguanylate cyclase (GGDEF)-like protein/PAS domain S-box-containing protein